MKAGDTQLYQDQLVEVVFPSKKTTRVKFGDGRTETVPTDLLKDVSPKSPPVIVEDVSPVLDTPVIQTPVLDTPVIQTPVLDTPVIPRRHHRSSQHVKENPQYGYPKGRLRRPASSPR